MQEIMLQMFDLVNMQENNLLVLAVYLGAAVLTVLLRIIVCLGYQTNLTFCKMNMKEYAAKADIKSKSIKPPLLNRVVKDYVKSAEKNISTVNTKAIVNKNILQLHFMGWSYSGIGRFIHGFEQAVVALGVLLVFVFDDYRFIYGFATLVSFLILRLLASLFDYELVRDKLLEEVTEYVDREIGQHYAGDAGSVLLRMQSGLTEAIDRQSAALSEAVRKMGTDMTGLLQLSMQEMTGHVAGYAETLKTPLESWSRTLEEAGGLQGRINQSLTAMEAAGAKILTASEGLDKSLSSYGETMSRQADAVREQITQLTQIASGITESFRAAEKSNENLARQFAYIERNQTLLETSLQQYESTLEGVTKSIGDGFGSILEFHIQSSYGTLNESLQTNLNKIIHANNELIERLKLMLDTMLEQSRGETQAIMKIKEQMDIHFEALSGRML